MDPLLPMPEVGMRYCPRGRRLTRDEIDAQRIVTRRGRRKYVPLHHLPLTQSHEDLSIARIDIERLVGRLPTKQRQAIVLHHLMGLTEKEMAHGLGASLLAVRQRKHDGIEKLRGMVA